MRRFDTMPPPRTRKYTVGWICALPVELAAAQAMLDEEYTKLPREKFDPNLYTLGRVGDLDVVITCLPAGHVGIGPAAAGAARMVSRFGSIRFGLMVGVGGGVPSPSVDIRLGDVVVSHPFKQHGGVVQYDLGKTVRAGQTTRTGSLNSPPPVLLNAVSQLRADRYRGRDSLARHMAGFDTFPRFRRMSSGPDILFEADCTHVGRLGCDDCDTKRYIQRSARQLPDQVEVHYGTIASGNQVMRDGITRDSLSKELGGVLCYEMEAAGLMNWFPCLVIRGISDYADSHKSKLWQPYAAATAAACAKAILHFVPPSGEATEDPMHSLGAYDLPFRIRPLSLKKFVDRPDDMRALKVALLPRSRTVGRSVMVVHGLSGIGKTQLVAHFARRHQRDFSSILWLDASNHVSLKQSLVSCVTHIRAHWCESASSTTSLGPIQDMDDGLMEMNEWLGRPDNWGWLLIVDGLQPDTNGLIPSSIYDYVPDVDHGAVLVTTHMLPSCEFGVSREIIKVDRASSAAIIKIWCSRDLGPQTDELLDLLDGLPVALVSVGRYISNTGMSLSTFFHLYRRQWAELMQACSRSSISRIDANLTRTWTLCYDTVKKADPPASNLLLLWSHLHEGSLWYGLLTPFMKKSRFVEGVTMQLGGIISDELDFANAIQTLRQHSLAITDQGERGAKLHPVVHRWAQSIQDTTLRTSLSVLALMVVGSCVQMQYAHSSRETQDCLRYHADQCLERRESLWLYYKHRGLDKDGYEDFWVPLQSFFSLRRVFDRPGEDTKAQFIVTQAFQLYEDIADRFEPLTRVK